MVATVKVLTAVATDTCLSCRPVDGRRPDVEGRTRNRVRKAAPVPAGLPLRGKLASAVKVLLEMTEAKPGLKLEHDVGT